MKIVRMEKYKAQTMSKLKYIRKKRKESGGKEWRFAEIR